MKMKLTKIDWIVVAIIISMLILPGPDDLLDLGTPLIECTLAVLYFLFKKFGGKMFG